MAQIMPQMVSRREEISALLVRRKWCRRSALAGKMIGIYDGNRGNLETCGRRLKSSLALFPPQRKTAGSFSKMRGFCLIGIDPQLGSRLLLIRP
jgi:hypothetical protein